MADGHMVAERTNTSSTVNLMYFTLDHLGSISVITDAVGAILERDSYDAWGKRRNLDGTPDTSCSIASSTTRGFTGQEMMASTCLINFNARIYDPSLGRFMSADPVVQNQFNLQVLNRYSYTNNNPLSLTDPTGNCSGFVGCFFAIVTGEIIWGSILKSIPILGDLFVIAADLACGPVGPLCAAVYAAGAAGAEGGHTGEVLKAFVTTFVQAEGLQLIGGTNWSLPTRALAAGFVGGAVSAASGGRFTSGFLAAGLSTLASPLIGDIAGSNKEVGTLVSAVLGGAASVVGGGKFANGAITGAFAYAVGSLQDLGDASNQPAPATAAGNKSQSAIDDQCLGFVACQEAQETANAPQTQNAEASCLYLSPQCNDLAPPTTRQDATNRAIAAGVDVLIVGTAGAVDSFGAITTFRLLWQFGNYANPESDAIPEIEAIKPPAPPAITEPYDPPSLPPPPKPPEKPPG